MDELEAVHDDGPEGRGHHDWPDNDEDHMWGDWYPQDRSTIRRVCVDPNCSAVQTKKPLV